MTGTTVSRPAEHPTTDEPPFPVRRVLLGLSGSVASALAPSWVYWARTVLMVQIRVVATDAALAFTTASALRALSGHEVATDRTPTPRAGPLHVVLSRWAEVALVAPATGNTLAKLAGGVADNVLCTTVLHCRCPVVVAPSLNDALVDAPSTRRNLARLRADGVGVVPTVEGLSLVDGTPVAGAMPDAPTVFSFAAAQLAARPAAPLAARQDRDAFSRTGDTP